MCVPFKNTLGSLVIVTPSCSVPSSASREIERRIDRVGLGEHPVRASWKGKRFECIVSVRSCIYREVPVEPGCKFPGQVQNAVEISSELAEPPSHLRLRVASGTILVIDEREVVAIELPFRQLGIQQPTAEVYTCGAKMPRVR